MANSVLLKESVLHTAHTTLGRNPLHCIVSPLVLERLANTNNERRRTAALNTLTLSNSIRVARTGKTDIGRPALRQLQRARLFGRQRRALWSAQGEGRFMEALEFTKQRVICSAQNSYRVPGVQVRSEGQGPTGDAAVDEAYDGLGSTFDLYANAYGRNSIDDT